MQIVLYVFIAGLGLFLLVLTIAVIIGYSFSAPAYKGPVSAHFDGTKFVNTPPFYHGFLDVIKWGFARDPGVWPKWIDEPYGPPPPERVADGRLRVTYINHATVLVQMDGVNILTDPVWANSLSPLGFWGPVRHRNPGLRMEDLPPLSAVLISHNHYDHMDVVTLRQLAGASNSQAPARSGTPRFITTLGNTQELQLNGIANSTDMDWWDTIDLGPVKVTCVPALHFSGRGIGDRNRTLWGGFVISGPSGSVYFVGDTGFGPQFEQVRQRFPDVRLALLPIGAYRPKWFMTPVHLQPDDAVRAHVALGARYSIPIHYGTFNQADDGLTEPTEDLASSLAERHPEKPFMVAKEGIGVEIP